MTTAWHRLWERYIEIDGKQIPLATYYRQQKFDGLSTEAKQVMQWLRKRATKRTPVSLIEMSKCLTPLALRKSTTIRAAMAELVAAGFATEANSPVYYSGRWRREAWVVDLKAHSIT